MKSLQKKIVISVLTLYFFAGGNMVHAADITSSDTIISKPVGAGILPGSGNEGTDLQSSIVFSKTIPFLITWGINLAIGLTVLVAIFGGYLFLTAFGDEEKRTKGTQTLIYAAIGLVVTLTAYGIVLIITRLQFS